MQIFVYFLFNVQYCDLSILAPAAEQAQRAEEVAATPPEEEEDEEDEDKGLSYTCTINSSKEGPLL